MACGLIFSRLAATAAMLVHMATLFGYFVQCVHVYTLVIGLVVAVASFQRTALEFVLRLECQA